MSKKKPKKPQKTKPTVFSEFKYEKPTTKNQREWNRQIERLERYEKRHKGLKINIPSKPTRITKKALQVISKLKGKKILQQSTIEVPDASGQKVEVNAEQFLDNIVPQGTAKQREKALQDVLRKKVEEEPIPQAEPERAEEPKELPTEKAEDKNTPQTPLERSQEPTEQTTDTQIEQLADELFNGEQTVTEEEWEKFFEQDKMTFNDSLHGMYHMSINEFSNANAKAMLDRWYYAMLDEVGYNEMSDILRDMLEDNDWVNFNVSYDLKYRLNWMYRMADRVQDEDISAWLHDYVDDLSQEWLGDTAESIMNGDYYWNK